MTISERTSSRTPGRLLGLLLAAAAALAPTAAVEARTLKIATISPEGSSWMRTMRGAAKAIRAETDGRVKIKFYPGGVMGDDKAVLRKLRIGQLHGAAVTAGVLEQAYQDIGAYSLPMLFESYAEVDYVRERLDAEIRANLRDAGWVTFGFGEAGFAMAMSTLPGRTVDDAQSQKVWAPDADPSSLVAIRAFGISPVPLTIADVLAGLQTGLIDAVTLPPVGALALQWHTQLKYIVDVPLMYIYGVLAVDRRTFDKLSAADQAVVTKHMEAAFDTINATNRKDHFASIEAMRGQGLELVTPTPAELDGWRERARLASERLVEEGRVSRAMADRLHALVAEYRDVVIGANDAVTAAAEATTGGGD